MIDFFASERHYADHLAPIWHALDPGERGRFWHMGRIAEHVLRLGVPPAALAHGRASRGGPDTLTVVAAYQDVLMSAPRPTVLLNHGAGQRYLGDPEASRHPSYSGSPDRGRIVLHLCPGEADAVACREAAPDIPAVAVGCPKLDRAHATTQPMHRPPVAALSFHFALKLVPETFWAFPHYREELERLAAEEDRGFDLIGHGHPRAWRELARFWNSIGIEPVEHFADVLARADLYVCDNSSTIYEFASTGRPVLLLNAPWYRRNVEHGLRFWDKADVGVQVDEPGQLHAGILDALVDTPARAHVREQVSAALYRDRDGHAAERAAAAVREVVRCRSSTHGT